MQGFDLVFAMFGLVLGLAVTEVLAGFARVIKMRRKAHVGWLTPLLGLFVLIDMTTFWNQVYAHREHLHANLAALLVVLAFGGVVLPASVLPSGPATFVGWLPSGALGEALRAALLDGRWDWRPLVVLAAWAVLLGAAARRWFRWSS